jgi:hypothetical protein
MAQQVLQMDHVQSVESSEVVDRTGRDQLDSTADQMSRYSMMACSWSQLAVVVLPMVGGCILLLVAEQLMEVHRLWTAEEAAAESKQTATAAGRMPKPPLPVE